MPPPPRGEIRPATWHRSARGPPSAAPHRRSSISASERSKSSPAGGRGCAASQTDISAIDSGLKSSSTIGFSRPRSELIVHPAIHHGPADVVVVVPELQQRPGHDELRHAEHLVKLLQFGKALGGDLLRPIVGGGHAERPRGGHRREFDVAGADPQIAAILAGAAPLHGGRDHHRRKEHGRPRVDRRR